MKWTPKPEPRLGETRSKNVFAWLPTKLDNGRTVVWLERYVAIQEYRRIPHPRQAGEYLWLWETIRRIKGIYRG